jgi:hypothetical protein
LVRIANPEHLRTGQTASASSPAATVSCASRSRQRLPERCCMSADSKAAAFTSTAGRARARRPACAWPGVYGAPALMAAICASGGRPPMALRGRLPAPTIPFSRSTKWARSKGANWVRRSIWPLAGSGSSVCAATRRSDPRTYGARWCYRAASTRSRASSMRTQDAVVGPMPVNWCARSIFRCPGFMASSTLSSPTISTRQSSLTNARPRRRRAMGLRDPSLSGG